MSDIKDFFISRWGNGWIVNADFSQLEVVVLAHLSKDPRLIMDIEEGLDMHTVRAAGLFNVPESSVTPKMRKLAKALSFQLQYGSGATNMAATNNIPVDTAREFIAQYYARYPKVKEWQDSNTKLVEASRVVTDKHTPLGYPVGIGWLKSETGREYCFFERDAPDFLVQKGKFTSFKPTEIKNYPVQGLATGDIVPLILGKVHRWLIESGYEHQAKLCNTVHDSIMLDVHDDVLYNVCSGVRSIMADAHNIYEKHFGVEFTLPIKVDIEYGRTWGDQTLKF